MADTYWEQPGNARAIPLIQLPNFTFSYGHFTHPPCFVIPSFSVKGYVQEWCGSFSCRHRGGSYVIHDTLLLGFPQAPFLSTDLHGAGAWNETKT